MFPSRISWRLDDLRTAPTPRRVTVLGLKGQGDVVNVEIDAHTQSIVRTVERYMLRLVGPPRT